MTEVVPSPAIRAVTADRATRPTDLLTAFFPVGVAFLISGAVVAGLTAVGAVGAHGHWLALHLVFLGGVSQLVLGAAQFFSTAFLATEPPHRRLIWGQLWVWSCGTLLVAVGVPSAHSSLTDAGGALVVAGLALFAYSLWQLERRSLQTARWAIRWYYASALMLGFGAVLGILMARGTLWTHGSLLGAHLTLNLAGWLGGAIVGTLHTFYPSLTLSRLRYPRLQAPTFAAWMGGVVTLAIGSATAGAGATALGLVGLTVAATLLTINVVGCALRAPGPLGLPALLIGVAQAFLLTALLVALRTILMSGPAAVLYGTSRDVLAVLLLAGWIGLTVAGSLLHLLSVLHRVRHLTLAMPQARPGPDRAITVFVAAAIATHALSNSAALHGLERPALFAVVGGGALLAYRILRVAAGAMLPPRIRSLPR